MAKSNNCRLCLDVCQQFKSLYDESGGSNKIYVLTYKYLHPTILNMDQAKNLTVICLPCWRHIQDFHNFKLSILVAQAQLCDYEAEEEPVVKKSDAEEASPSVNEQSLKETLTSNQDTVRTAKRSPPFKTSHIAKSKDTLFAHDDKENKNAINVKADSVSESPADFVFPYTDKTFEDHPVNNSGTALFGSSVHKINIPSWIQCQDFSYEPKHNQRNPIDDLDDAILKSDVSSLCWSRSPKANGPLMEHFNNSQKYPTLRNNTDTPMVRNEQQFAPMPKLTLIKVRNQNQDFSKDNTNSKSSLSLMTVEDPSILNTSKDKEAITLRSPQNPGRGYKSMPEYPTKPFRINSEGHVKSQDFPKSNTNCKSIISVISDTSKDKDEIYLQSLTNLRRASKSNPEYPPKVLNRAKRQRRIRSQDMPNDYVNSTRINSFSAAKDPQILKEKFILQTPENLQRFCKSKPEFRTKPARIESKKSIEELDALIAKTTQTTKCKVCLKSFGKFSLLRQHFHRQHSEETFHLSCCQRKLTSITLIKDHFLYHSDSNAFKCEKCNRCHGSKTALKRHWARNHTVVQDLGNVCKICRKGFHTKGGLNMHYTRMHSISRWPKNMTRAFDECGDGGY